MKRTTLKKKRRQLGLSQTDVANKLGIAEVTVRMIESGTKDPSSKLAVKYANFFHEELAVLFPDIFLLRFDTKSTKEKQDA